MNPLNEDLIDSKQAAAYLHVALRTLEGWRHRLVEGSPPFFRLGGKVRYSKRDLDQWLQKQRVVP